MANTFVKYITEDGKKGYVSLPLAGMMGPSNDGGAVIEDKYIPVYDDGSSIPFDIVHRKWVLAKLLFDADNMHTSISKNDHKSWDKVEAAAAACVPSLKHLIAVIIDELFPDSGDGRNSPNDPQPDPDMPPSIKNEINKLRKLLEPA